MKNTAKASSATTTSKPTIRLYNTLTRKIEPFAPRQAGAVSFYTCGPTVYDFAHIGNLRTFVYQDVLRRSLEYAGFRVQQVMNITDIDDKTIIGARRAKQPLRTFTEQFTESFFSDLAKLNIEPAETYTRATEYIPQMVAFIQVLLKKGIAYQKEGSVYFSIKKFPRYGRLSQLERRELKTGARVASDEYTKDNPADFALWKAWTPADGEVYWETTLGKGRPGWHIECSVMSTQELGETIDIHSGGVDLIFPHHENEIAQSEAVTGKPFVRFWVHPEHLMVEGEKMAKSKGNQYTLRDIEKRGIPPLAFRYLTLQTHYRSKMDFTWESLHAAQQALERIRELQFRDGNRGTPATNKKIEAAIFNDLDIPQALALLHEARSWEAWQRFDRILSLGLGTQKLELTKKEKELIDQREQARQAADFGTADRLRKELAKQGILLEDTPQGPRVIRK